MTLERELAVRNVRAMSLPERRAMNDRRGVSKDLRQQRAFLGAAPSPETITARGCPIPFTYYNPGQLKFPIADVRELKKPFDQSELSFDENKICYLSDTEDEYSGLWVSEGGSLYSFDGCRFVCIAVHSTRYRGWTGKIAVDEVLRIGLIGSGLQAFRCKTTGAIMNWVSIDLMFEKDTVTKLFPRHLPSSLLVYGHEERYFRI